MELVELTLVNFKRFTSEVFRFSPGLNLFFGLNESGKSTIHEAICCALFGRERGKAVESWGGGSCTVSLSYRTDGKVYRIERRLTEGVARLGIVSGDDLVDVITGKSDVEDALEQHLGISSRLVFDNTVSVRQTNMSRPESSDMEAVGSEIQRVLTGAAHVSASDVLKTLDAQRNGVKGKARPANPREFDKITERLNKLADELANARRSRAQIHSLEEELETFQARVDRDSARLDVLAKLLERHKRWCELTQRESEKDTLHQGVFQTVNRIKDAITDLGIAQKELGDYADLVGKDDEIADNLKRIESRQEELGARIRDAELSQSESESTASGASPALFLAGGILGVIAGAILGYILHPWALLLMIPGAGLLFLHFRMRSRGRAGEHQRFTEMLNATQNDLKQLAIERKSILSYIGCKDTAEAWQKIGAYRKLAAHVRELEIALNILLAGRKVSDWESQEQAVSRELSDIRREISDHFPDYSPSTQETEGWRSEYAGLQGSLPAGQARLHEVRGSLDAERRNARDLALLEGEIEYLHKRKSELEFLYKAYGEAIATLTQVTETVSEEYLPILSERAGGLLNQVTDGRYTSVSVSRNWETSVDGREKSKVLPLVLSIGTLDQLYFALRVACGELLSSGRKLPMILDDPFTAFDRQRMDNALHLLTTLAEDNQVLLLTHDSYIRDWMSGLIARDQVSCVLHELPSPA